ncbi:LLM class flavin-dependent oxidoreductase [Amycolatopsis sp. NPDC051372]|uniref:LLM class flavin-dependent oxidoreductase n=1 Tax=unclassified Amycolatopsis TaxID=2618356 RepID=UPI00343A65D7
MKIGTGLPNQVRNLDPTVIPSIATRAEEAGFSTLGTVGRIAFPGVMDTVALAAAAGATRRIGLLTNVLLATVWPATLLAKEVASIDGVSGGRLTLGVGIGGRPDDFVVEGRGPKGLGRRIDGDLETYRSVWNGDPVGGGENAAVPSGSRRVPLLFGGSAPAALARMARWGEGYVAGTVPAEMAGEAFAKARTAWQEHGRDGDPRLVGLAYFSLGDPDRGRANVRDYYSTGGDELADFVCSGVRTTADEVRTVVKEYAELGTDELLVMPTTDDVTDIERLADIVL